MRHKVLSIIMILSFALTGCMALPKPEKVLKKIESAESYSSEARMAVQNNKSIFNYNLKQYYKKQGKYRIDFFDDSGAVKQTIIYNNGRCTIFHTDIDKPFKTDNYAETKEHNSFLSAFLDNYKNDPNAKCDFDKSGNGGNYAYQCSIDNGNPYFKRAILSVNPKDAHPRRLTIFAEDNIKIIEVEYKAFQYNIPLEDSLFNIENE